MPTTGMTRSFGQLVSDPAIDPRVRRAFDRFSKPFLWVTNEAPYLDDQGRIALRLASGSLTQSASGLNTAQNIQATASPTFAGLTLTSFTGYLYATAGVVSAVNPSFSLTLNTQTTTTGNGAGAETTLFSYTVPANTLSVDGDVLDISVAGKFGANANADKRIRVYFGATMFYDSGVQSPNDRVWSARARIFRTGSATQKCELGIHTTSSTIESDAGYATAAEDLTGGVVLKITGSGTSANDVLGECWKVVKVPA